MKRPLQFEILQSRYVKGLVAVVVTVFLGAIGSGLWNLMLAPLVERLSAVSLSLMSSVFHGYADILYRNVSRNPSEMLTVAPFAAVVTIYLAVPWVGLYAIFRALGHFESKVASTEEDKSPEVAREQIIQRIKRIRRVAVGVGVPMALVSTLLYSEVIIEAKYSRTAATFIERSIEIVAPYVDERERLALRGQFRAIENAADFYRLEDRIRGIASQYSVTLPRFESIR